MFARIAYPWFFFYRIARLSLAIFVPALFIGLFTFKSSFQTQLQNERLLISDQYLNDMARLLKESKLPEKDWCTMLHPSEHGPRFLLINKKNEVICDSHKSQLDLDLFVKSQDDDDNYSSLFKNHVTIGRIQINKDLNLLGAFPYLTKKSMNLDEIFLLKIFPIAVLSYFIFLFLFFRTTKPLGNILAKVKNFNIDIPFEKNLQLLYRKNEWAKIEEALNNADIKLKEQVTSAKNENERFTAILESIHDDIIAIDNYETILFYNSNFNKNFIANNNDQKIIPKLWHIFEGNTEVLESFNLVLKDGQKRTLKSLSFPNLHNAGKFFDLTITPLRSIDGNIRGALGVFYDITEFKLTEQMRVDFVANISHEIRTPLTSIKGYSQILESQKNKIDSSLHLFLDKINSNTERMISLFNDLLSLSVIESQNMIKHEELNLHDLFTQVIDNIQTSYPNKKIEFDIQLEAKTIRGDHRLMEQVFTNITDNACKYSHTELSLKIRSTQIDQIVRLTIGDNGLGISKEHVQRIFERFYRADSSREKSRGAGLGLSIVKHIINKHGGKIIVESEESKGSTFIIDLPA